MTKDEAQANLDSWLTAEAAIAKTGQAYSLGSHTLTRADMSDIRQQIQYWRREVRRFEETAKGSKRGGVTTPNFNR